MRLQFPLTSALLLAVAGVIALATGALIAFAFSRRRRRERHFRAADEARESFVPIVHGILANRIDYAVGVEALRAQCSPGSIRALERTLLTSDLPDAALPLRLRLCEDLGLVGLWQRQLTGRPSDPPARADPSRAEGLLERLLPLSFVGRAESAQSLGLVRHAESWRILVAALDDPSLDVRTAAATALGHIQAPESVPVLVALMEAAAQSPSPALSVRQIKAVLVSFPLKRGLEDRKSVV